LRDDVTVIASGKIATGGEVATHIALGADLVRIGREFLFSIGGCGHQRIACYLRESTLSQSGRRAAYPA
jgi:glutamate synthase domain-containing protein 2